MSCFQNDGLRKVFEIFSNDRVDDDVRISAGEQLSVMMQGNLHTYILEKPSILLKNLLGFIGSFKDHETLWHSTILCVFFRKKDHYA